MAKPAMVVWARSYGTPVTIVKRGPQWVQLTNGWRYRRSAGSASSARQSAQVAESGETSVRAGPPVREARMVNAVPPTGGISRWWTDSTRASGGAWAAIRSQNRATAEAVPSTSTTTPSGVLVTCPARASSVARPYR